MPGGSSGRFRNSRNRVSVNSTGADKAMGSKQEILATLRRGHMPPVELPSLDGPWLTFDRPRDQFCQILAAVGGQSLVVPAAGTLDRALAELPLFRAARNVWSLVPPVPSTGRDW